MMSRYLGLPPSSGRTLPEIMSHDSHWLASCVAAALSRSGRLRGGTTWMMGSANTKRARGSTERTASMQAMEARTSWRSEEHTSELQSRGHLVCRLLPEKKNRGTQALHGLD